MVATAPLTTSHGTFTPGSFSSPWWLPGGHAQTIYGGRLRPAPPLQVITERWTMSDGQELRVDRSEGRDARAPSLVVLHGLESHCDVAHIQGMIGAGHARGWAGFALSFRGCSGVPITVPRSYHAGFTEDLEECVQRVARERPHAPILLVGFSLGGNVVLKFMGENPAAVRQVVAATTISAPFSLQHCTAALDGKHPLMRVYRSLFLHDIRNKVRHYQQSFPGHIDDVKAEEITSFARFDALVSTRRTGAPSVEEYWRLHSSGSYLQNIRVPSLLINAWDDPMVPGGTVPVDVVGSNSNLVMSLQREGGHISFAYGAPHAPRFFAEEEAVRFFETVLSA